MNCFDPSPVSGVIFSPFSDTTEGANISFNCELGLEPQREGVSVCSSSGIWVPDPEDMICYTPPSEIALNNNIILIEMNLFYTNSD